MRRKYRPLLIQTGTPMLDDVTRRKPGRRHFRQLSGGGRGIPPIATGITTSRAISITTIADYAGISNASWSTGTTGQTGAFPTDESSWNYFYHYYTIPNIRTSTYEKVLDPVRVSIAAPATDGGEYDFWTSETQEGSLLFPHTYPFDEVCPKVLPTDSHCDFSRGPIQLYTGNATSLSLHPFNRGYLRYSTSEPDYQPNRRPANLKSIDPSYTWVDTMYSIYAIQKRLNGVAVGSVIVNPKETGPEWEMTVSKGNTVELDIWYKIKARNLTGHAANPGRGYVYRATSVVSTSRICERSDSAITFLQNPIGNANLVNTIQFRNVNATPEYNYTLQTYNITLAGHTGWTLKDGSNGPHKIKSGNGWLAIKSGAWTNWQNSASRSFKNLWVLFDREVPSIVLANPGLDYTGAGGSPSDTLHYRPTFGASTSYRRTTAYREVKSSSDGSTWQASGTATHAPSGVFNQNGTTTFDLVSWDTGGYSLDTQRYSRMQGVTGQSTGVSFPAAHVPTTITLTQVDI